MEYLQIICVFLISWLIIKFLTIIFKTFIRKPLNLLERYGSNSWVLVTGATEGIGREFCEQFAKKGFNIILVSRNAEKLQNIQAEIIQKYPSIQATHIPFDFSKQTKPEDYEEAFGGISKQYDISVLINNVGFAVGAPFRYISSQQVSEMININCMSQTLLTSIFLNGLLSREKRSAVIDVSSISSLMPLPKLSVYAATKVFNNYMTRTLAEELKDENIDFLSLKPAFVESNMSKKKADGYYVITPQQCVTGALRDLGYEIETFGYWTHKLQGFMFGLIYLLIKYGFFFRNGSAKSKRNKKE
jgi:17beta-estradiol 17-dehydrogenase / very-long-chain 3-oxoacyl-CoA reductase